MTGQLRETLRELGESMPEARLTPDVWRRGRRARTRGRVLRIGAAVVVVGLVFALAPWSSRSEPEINGDAVSTAPRTVGVPWMWQATVQQDAPGPVSVLFGGDTIGLRGTDWFDSEGKLAAVGAGSGKTRTLLYGGTDDITAGEDVLLSPDGRSVASPFLLEGELDTGSAEGLVVTDLTMQISCGADAVAMAGDHGRCLAAPAAWLSRSLDSGALNVEPDPAGGAALSAPSSELVQDGQKAAQILAG